MHSPEAIFVALVASGCAAPAVIEARVATVHAGFIQPIETRFTIDAAAMPAIDIDDPPSRIEFVKIARCPIEMAIVDNRVCVDKWEGSLVERMRDGSDREWSP